jgi:hypothetical protein
MLRSIATGASAGGRPMNSSKLGLMQKALLACGSMVLFFFSRSFLRPAEPKNELLKKKSMVYLSPTNLIISRDWTRTSLVIRLNPHSGNLQSAICNLQSPYAASI